MWLCGLVGMIVVRRREEPGEGHCWIVGGLAGWRVCGLAGWRVCGSSILSSTILEVCEDARMRGLRACKDWVSDRLVYRNHWDRIPQTAYSHGSLRP